MKKIIAFGFILFAMMIAGLSCAPEPPQNDKIVLWHWMTDRDSVLQELAAEYEKQTGVKVVVELYAPTDVYSQKVIAAAQAKILPDIFGILDKKIVVAEFVKGHFVADLTSDFKANEAQWENSISALALAASRFEENNSYSVTPGIYGVPIDMMDIPMIYNKKLLKKAGITKVPENLAQWLEVSAALKRSGISGFVSGWGELWLVDAFAFNYAFNIMGQDKLMATFRGQISYTDPSWIKVFKVFADLRDHGLFAPGIVTKTNKDAERDFALERAAFAFNGSWCVNVYKQMNPDLDYGIMLPPAANPQNPMKIWGSAGTSFFVNNSSAKKDKAIAFLKWLTDKKQQMFLVETTHNLPVNSSALVDRPPILSDFARMMDAIIHPTIWPFYEDVLVLEAFDRGLQQIIVGERTPKQVAEEVQKVKVRQMEKHKTRK